MTEADGVSASGNGPRFSVGSPRGLLAAVIVIVVLLVVLPLALMAGTGTETATLPGATRSPDQRDPEAGVAALLTELTPALARGNASSLSTLADPDLPSAASELRQLARNARLIRVRDLRLRVLDRADGVLSSSELSAFADDAFAMNIELTWRLTADARPSTVDLPVVFGWEGSRATFLTARVPDADARAPLWFIQKLAVRRSPRTLVMAPTGAEADRLAAQATRAIRTVAAVLPRWRRTLVVEAPQTSAEFVASSGLSVQDAAAIAAVTTTTDGSTAAEAPTHVFLNPAVFGPLGDAGQQIVLSHEATHVALGAVNTTVPLWLSEGIADYVALRDSSLSTSVLASQILAQVRRDGPPRALPGPAEFDGSNTEIGAWYEAAWLAARLVADRYGEDALLSFYRQAERDGGTDRAFAELSGTDERAFTQAWRQELVRLAG